MRVGVVPTIFEGPSRAHEKRGGDQEAVMNPRKSMAIVQRLLMMLALVGLTGGVAMAQKTKAPSAPHAAPSAPHAAPSAAHAPAGGAKPAGAAGGAKPCGAATGGRPGTPGATNTAGRP